MRKLERVQSELQDINATDARQKLEMLNSDLDMIVVRINDNNVQFAGKYVIVYIFLKANKLSHTYIHDYTNIYSENHLYT